MALTADQLLKSQDLTVEQVDTPEWGENAHIRQMNGDELGIFSKLIKGTKEVQEFPIDAIAVVCALTLCNEAGERLFKDHTAGAKALAKKNADVLNRIFQRSMILSSLTADKGKETPGKG